MRKWIAILMVVSGCADGPSSATPSSDDCGASTLGWLVGQPASVLESMMLPADHRVLYPDTPMTRDFRVERLNIYVTKSGTIRSVDCR